jgi:hypothetical protein
MSLSKTFKTDPALEKTGVEIEMPPNDDGTIPTFTIARAGRNNPEYQKVMDRVMKPHRRADQLGALKQAKKDELTREIFAEAGVLNWKNVEAADVFGTDSKKHAPYTKDNAISLFKRLPELYAVLIEFSVDRATFLEAEKEEDAKNSVKSSPIALTTQATSAD